MRRTIACRLALASFAWATAVAHAGGPLGICNSAPLKYSPASVTLNYDGGGNLGVDNLGVVRTKARADAIVTTASSLWTNVGTATINIARGPDLPGDITLANYKTYYNDSNPATFSDGLSPVIYDNDGSIIDDLLGVGNKSSILGFAGSVWYGSPTCRYAEGRAVINGFIQVPDTTMTNVLAHELGHLIGLDHSQIDGAQGLAQAAYPLMYPIAYRQTTTLHEDDAAAVSALYPDATVPATYGTLTGNFLQANGATPIPGANIWAKETTTNLVYSGASGWLGAGDGAFRMLLPAGTYTLHAEAVHTNFKGGSSVGPYSDLATDPSFQAPLYVNGVAMAPLTLGNASPVTFTITAGCTATATFKFDGTGSVNGCSATPTVDPPRLANISTRGKVLTGSDVMIGGFIIGGTASKTVVVRARGPSLTALGVPGALPNPFLQVVRSSDNVTIAANDDWQSAPNAPQISATGFAPSNALESAALMTLAPGAYTAIVSGSGGATGVGLIEVFEVDHPEVPLINIATRGKVLTGSDVMIGGFIIQGNAPQSVVVRARGPSLTAAGVPGVLANPMLQLVRSSDGATLATNDDWATSANAAQITATGFAPSNPLESAILVTLNPGAYTAIVSGAGSGTGVGIVEVFKTP